MRIDDGGQVRSADFTLTYDPAVLAVTGVQRAAGLPGDWAVNYNLATPGQVRVTLYGTATDLPAGPRDLVTLSAAVPAAAPYGAAEAVRVDNVVLSRNDASAVPAKGDEAVHKVAFLGDADGSRDYSGFDAALLSRVVVGLDTGFDAFPLTDPLIVADAAGPAGLTGLDASFVAQKAAGLARPEIPDLPAAAPPPPPAGGPDPLVGLPAQLSASAGGRAAAPLTVDDAAGTLGFNVTVTYDTARLDLAAADVAKGALLLSPDDWVLVPNVDKAAGRATLVFYRASGVPMPAGGGTLATLGFAVSPAAPAGRSPWPSAARPRSAARRSRTTTGALWLLPPPPRRPCSWLPSTTARPSGRWSAGLTVTFDRPVALDAGAFTLAGRNGAGAGHGRVPGQPVRRRPDVGAVVLRHARSSAGQPGRRHLRPDRRRGQGPRRHGRPGRRWRPTTTMAFHRLYSDVERGRGQRQRRPVPDAVHLHEAQHRPGVQVVLRLQRRRGGRQRRRVPGPQPPEQGVQGVLIGRPAARPARS